MRIIDKILQAFRPGKEEFAQIVTDMLHLHGVEGEIQYLPGPYALKLPDGDTIFLANHYLAYRKADPAEREKILTDIADTISPPSLPMSFEEAKAQLRPIITTVAEMELNALELQVLGYEPPCYAFIPFAGEVVLSLGLDTPQNTIQVTREQLERWNVSLDFALDKAERNLKDQSAPQFVDMNQGVYQSDWNDGYDVSRLLFPQLIAAEAPVKGKYVAMLPNRNYLLLTGSENDAGLERLANLAKSILDEEPHPLSAEILVMAGNEWKPLPLDESRASHRKLSKLKNNHLFTLYDRQKKLLDKLYEDDEDIFVATLNAREDDGGHTTTYAAWTEGVNTLLPEADLIVFIPDEGEPFGASWEKVRNTLADEFKPRGMHPERYLVTKFPSSELLESFRVD